VDEITATVQKITRGVKSGEKAREIMANFFQNHDPQTNWKLIGAFRNFTQQRRNGRRTKKKIADVEAEILNYLCETFSGGADNVTEEIIGEYENILAEAVMDIYDEQDDVNLALLPFFYDYPKALVALENAGIKTVNQFLSSDNTTITDILDGSDELITDLFFFFRMLGFIPGALN
jgi:hypothetical protein